MKINAWLAMLVVGCLASPAAAWAPIHPSQPRWPGEVQWRLNSAGSDNLSFDQTLAEVRRGMLDWTRVSCSALQSTYAGTTSARAGSGDGVSAISWSESSWSHESSAIGVTGPRWGPSGIIEADMEMNGVNYTWVTDGGSGNRVDTYSITLHEGGHFYGLGHTNVRGSSMWPAYGGGIVGLGPDDEAGICALYPGEDVDCTTTGCPTGQECVEGRCEAIVGDGTVCAPCTGASDCGGPSDFCLRYPDGASYCGRACGSSADCMGGQCVALSVGNQCIGVDGGTPSCAGFSECEGPGDCAEGEECREGRCVEPDFPDIGEPCEGNEECESGLCVAGTCTATCQWASDSSCPEGFYCNADASSSSCNEGYCQAGTAGPGALGAGCSADTDCESLHCDRGLCSQPCTPEEGGVAGCPDGFTCQPGGLPCRGSCHRLGDLGDFCEMNSDCRADLCAMTEGDGYCSETCSDNDPCPDDFTCTDMGATSICTPDGGTLGESCDTSEDCLSELCATAGGENFCTRRCDESIPCPESFECAAVSETESVCRPVEMPRSDGCGCRVGAAPARPIAGWFAIAGIGLWFARRRRHH